MEDPRKHLCEIAQLTYDRFLTDSAGGNFSVRQADRIYCTPRYAGGRWQWRLQPEQIVVTDMEGRKLAGEGELSREYEAHLRLYQAFPEAGGVCHAHSPHVMVFAHMERPIPPTSEQTARFGVITACERYGSHTPELAAAVVRALEPRRAELTQHAIACLMPYHGIIVAARDLDEAFEALEGLDGSARVLIARATFETLDHLQRLTREA